MVSMNILLVVVEVDIVVVVVAVGVAAVGLRNSEDIAEEGLDYFAEVSVHMDLVILVEGTEEGNLRKDFVILIIH